MKQNGNGVFWLEVKNSKTEQDAHKMIKNEAFDRISSTSAFHLFEDGNNNDILIHVDENENKVAIFYSNVNDFVCNADATKNFKILIDSKEKSEVYNSTFNAFKILDAIKPFKFTVPKHHKLLKNQIVLVN